MIKSGPLRGRTNVVLLFMTYALGQGVLLLAQSWLVFKGEYAYLGQFGLSFTLITLLYYLIDWGGMTLLARHELAERDEESRAHVFWDLSWARLGLAVPGAAGLILYGSLSGDDFISAYAFATAPTLVLGAFNPTGLIDGLRRSGANGMAAMLPILASAVVLVPAAALDPQAQGLVTGIAFTVGTAGSLLFQYFVLKGAHRIPQWERPNRHQSWIAGRQGAAILLTAVPTLVFYRIEISASMLLLGPATTGVLVYARQIVGVALQAGLFIRRTEFPSLIHLLRTEARLMPVLKAQRMSIGCITVCAFALALVGPGAYLYAPPEFRLVGIVMAEAYAVILIVSGLGASVTQALLGLDRARTAALSTNLLAIAASVAIFPAVSLFGIYGFPIIDFALNLALFVWLARQMRNAARALPAEPAHGAIAITS